jgi:hypothetical protein
MTTTAAHVLRPGHSRRPITSQRADVPVAEPVVDEGEQPAGRGNLGDALAAAVNYSFLVGAIFAVVG